MGREVHPFRSRLPLRCLIACIFSWVESDLLRHRMQIANFAKLAACLFPDAPEEECLMMSYYHLWVPHFVFAFVSYSFSDSFSSGVSLG